MPVTGHTWTAEERKAAKDFARSLGESRLQFARTLTNRPTASAEDVVDILVQQKRELAWVTGYFDAKKPDIISFLRSQRPFKADLRLTCLGKTSANELTAVLESYFTQVAKFDISIYKLLPCETNAYARSPDSHLSSQTDSRSHLARPCRGGKVLQGRS